MEAKCDGWTKYFEGRITQVNRDDTYDIKFDDGERKRGVLKNKIRLIRRKTKTNRRNRREYSSESNEDLDSENENNSMFSNGEKVYVLESPQEKNILL